MQGLHTYQPKPFQYVDIETLIPQNHILRKIDKLLDLSFVRELTSQYYCHNNGRPSIDPELFFRMILIGYIFGIRHDRRLCEEVGYNLAYRWYCRLSLEDSIPDHSTLSKIRDRYGLTVFEGFFDKVIGICRKLGLVKGGRVITDSTLIEADASLDSMVIKKASEPLSQQEKDNNTQALSLTKKLSNQTHISTTDSDSSLAKKPGSNKGLKYKVHTSIDADSRVILDNKVTTGSCHDTQIYLERLQYIQNKYNFLIKEVIADRGYGAAENIQSLQEQKITSYIPLFSSNSGKIVKLEEQGFIFDKEHNKYICSQGKFLLPKEREDGAVYKSKTEDCKNCSVSKDCVASLRQYSQHIRHIYRSHNQSFFEIEQQRMQTPGFIKKMKERMWKIEGINAEAKNLHALKRAKYRGLSKVQIQAYMTGAVQNLKRLIHATIIDILHSIYNICSIKSLIISHGLFFDKI
jgi:transposase